LIYYIAGCYGMRQYDNAAYDFFYFSDWNDFNTIIKSHKFLIKLFNNFIDKGYK
jgi:hypothetical protein